MTEEATNQDRREEARRARAHPDSGLTQQQVDGLERTLLDIRRRIIEERQRHLDAARFTDEPVSEAEEAAALDASQSTLIELAESERVMLDMVDRALAKMRDGTYGVSEDSGEPIGYDRLGAVPWASLSAPDEEMLEHRLRERGR
jgi:DnaK suppressor protein